MGGPSWTSSQCAQGWNLYLAPCRLWWLRELVHLSQPWFPHVWNEDNKAKPHAMKDRIWSNDISGAQRAASGTHLRKTEGGATIVAQWVKLPPATPASQIGVPVWVLDCFRFSCLWTCLERCRKIAWVLGFLSPRWETRMKLLASWRPSPGYHDPLGMSQLIEDLSLSHSLPLTSSVL